MAAFLPADAGGAVTWLSNPVSWARLQTTGVACLSRRSTGMQQREGATLTKEISSASSGPAESAQNFKGTEVVVETDSEGSHMGYPICDGPAVMRLMLTRPYNSQGQIVEIPLSEIDSVKKVELRPIGETPPIAE
jgi:hypothetical protein